MARTTLFLPWAGGKAAGCKRKEDGQSQKQKTMMNRASSFFKKTFVSKP
jgi:hypothetical protein